MTRALDWDSLDSGCLHQATSLARTMEGTSIIVGVLDQVEQLSELLDQAEQDRRENQLPPETPLWLYVPTSFNTPLGLPPTAVLKPLP